MILMLTLTDIPEKNYLQNPSTCLYLVWPTYELYCSQQLAAYDMCRQLYRQQLRANQTALDRYKAVREMLA
jgi:hypothetical protein